MSRTVVRSSLCLAVAIALLLPAAYVVAGKGGIPLKVTIDNTGGLIGDNIKNVDPYPASTDYIDGDLGPITLLRVQLISNSKTLALDTRGAGRTLLIDFGTLDNNTKIKLEALGLQFAPGTCVPGSDSNSYESYEGCVLETEALFEVLLSQPFPTTGYVFGVAKLWFTMGDSDWRVDWTKVMVTSKKPVEWGGKVHRVWGVTAPPDAGLSNLSGKRTKPGSIGTEGSYPIEINLLATEM